VRTLSRFRYNSGLSMARSALRPALVLCVLASSALSMAGAALAKPPNPCLDPERRAHLRCPDLVMAKPFGLTVDPFVKLGRLVLRAGNSIDSVGRGPVELHGIRISRHFMRGRQRIYKRAGGRIGINTGARIFFKYVRGQTSYWKFHNAARFELWLLNARGERTRLSRVGPKVSYCLRDLKRTHPGARRSPRRMVYPACSTIFSLERVTLGTSVGWSDVYPPTYPEQWIDVTGLRGCFDYVHIADPYDRIYESKERNNSATVTVRLPFRPGPQRCAGRRSSIPGPRQDDRPPGY
jgi:hypothetical protein